MIPNPPKSKMRERARRFDVAAASCANNLMGSLASGQQFLGELAAMDAADMLANWNTRDGWPFFVRIMRALEAAEVLT